MKELSKYSVFSRFKHLPNVHTIGGGDIGEDGVANVLQSTIEPLKCTE